MNEQFGRAQQNYVPHDNLKRKYHLRFMLNGMKKSIHTKAFMQILLANVACTILLLMVHISGLLGEMLTFLWRTAGVAVLLVADAVTFFLLGAPKEYTKTMQLIEKIPGFQNDDGEKPIFLERKDIDEKRNVEMWTFQSFGIGFDEWSKHLQQLENALDIAILSIGYGQDNTQTELKVLQHPGPWPDGILWSDTYLPMKDSQLVLGLNRSYPVMIDLAVNPHHLISAETGAGKSVLIRCLLHQAVMKGYKTILVDFKHFVDYHDLLNKVSIAIDEREELGRTLQQLVDEMESRLQLLFNAGCPNIDIYNQKHSETPLQRILCVIDEYTEAMDRGTSKEQKAKADALENLVARLCMRSRSAGISIIIGLQRAGMNVNEYVRNNSRVILGRCSDNLSLVATGSTELGRMIPPDSVGMFVTDKRELFKAFYGGFEMK